MSRAPHNCSHWMIGKYGVSYQRGDGVIAERSSRGNFPWYVRRGALTLNNAKRTQRFFKSAETAMQAADKEWPL